MATATKQQRCEQDCSPTPDNREFVDEIRTIDPKYVRQVPRKYRAIYERATSGKSRKAAVRAFCLECVGWQAREVDLCTSPGCPLYPYRLTG